MKKTKRIACVLIVTLLLGGGFAYASSLQSITVSPNTVTVKVNGQAIKADNFLYQGTTYVPLRTVSENLGMDVNWDQKSKTAFIADYNALVAGKYLLLEGRYDMLTEAALSVFQVFLRDESETVESIQRIKTLVFSAKISDDMRQTLLDLNDTKMTNLVNDHDNYLKVLYLYTMDLEDIKKNDPCGQLTLEEFGFYSENIIEIMEHITTNRESCRDAIVDALY